MTFVPRITSHSRNWDRLANPCGGGSVICLRADLTDALKEKIE
jgi:hypothetical protein